MLRAAAWPWNSPWLGPGECIRNWSQTPSFAEIPFYSMTPGTSLVLITCKHHDPVSCPSALVQPNPRATEWMFLWNSWGWKAKGWMGKKTQIVAEQTHGYNTFSWYFPCQVTEMTALPSVGTILELFSKHKMYFQVCLCTIGCTTLTMPLDFLRFDQSSFSCIQLL